MNHWADKYEDEPQPMWIEEFQDDSNKIYTDGPFTAEYLCSENNGCDGRVHYFKIYVDWSVEWPTEQLVKHTDKFARMFYYAGRGPGHLFCLFHSVAVFGNMNNSGILRINEDYDN